MPTYQYACTECDHAFEQVQSFSDSSLTDCPRCEGRLRKIFNAVGVVFKGSGFYRTDSRTDTRTEGKKSGGSDGSADAASTSSAAAASSKPEPAAAGAAPAGSGAGAA